MSEHFQCQMTETLQDMEGIVCHIDKILVHGKNHNEHGTRLKAVLHRLQEHGLTLNANKCQFQCTKVKFLGQIINGKQICPNPVKDCNYTERK